MWRERALKVVLVLLGLPGAPTLRFFGKGTTSSRAARAIKKR